MKLINYGGELFAVPNGFFGEPLPRHKIINVKILPTGDFLSNALKIDIENIPSPKPKKIPAKRFFWYCTWTNGKGGYNPDYEDCPNRSKSIFKSWEDAKANALRNHPKHDGYVFIGYLTPSGKRKTCNRTTQ